MRIQNFIINNIWAAFLYILVNSFANTRYNNKTYLITLTSIPDKKIFNHNSIYPTDTTFAEICIFQIDHLTLSSNFEEKTFTSTLTYVTIKLILRKQYHNTQKNSISKQKYAR